VRSPRLVLSAFVAVLAVFSIGCSFQRPVLTKRFREISTSPVPTVLPVLEVFALNKPADPGSSSPLLWPSSLSDRAQAEVVKVLGSAIPPAKLREALVVPKKAPARMIDLTRFERRVVASIEYSSAEPADRLDRVDLRVRFEDRSNPSARFDSWNHFTTKYQTVDLGDVKATQARESTFNLKFTPEQIQEVAEASSGWKASRSLEEVTSLQQRFIESSGILSGKEARLIQQGAAGMDLMGNVTMDVQISVGEPSEIVSVQVAALSDLTMPDGRPNEAPKVGLRYSEMSFVDMDHCGPVRANASLRARLRHVFDGGETFLEGDDVVAFKNFDSMPVTFEIVPRELLRATVFTLISDAGQRLHLRPATMDAPSVVQLASFEEADELRKWLAASARLDPKQAAIAGADLYLGQDAATLAQVGALTISREQLNWGPPGSGRGCA